MYDFIIILLISYSMSQARDIPPLKQSLKQKVKSQAAGWWGSTIRERHSTETAFCTQKRSLLFPAAIRGAPRALPELGQFQLSLSVLRGSPVGPTVTPGQRSAGFLENLHPTSQLLRPSSQSSASPHHNTTKITQFQDGLDWKGS